MVPRYVAKRLAAAAVWLASFYFGEIGTLGTLRKIENDIARELRYPLEILVIQFIGRIGRPVIIFVRAGEEIQDRNILRVEAGHVGRQIRIVLEREIESGGDVSFLDQSSPRVR